MRIDYNDVHTNLEVAANPHQWARIATQHITAFNILRSAKNPDTHMTMALSLGLAFENLVKGLYVYLNPTSFYTQDKTSFNPIVNHNVGKLLASMNVVVPPSMLSTVITLQQSVVGGFPSTYKLNSQNADLGVRMTYETSDSCGLLMSTKEDLPSSAMKPVMIDLILQNFCEMTKLISQRFDQEATARNDERGFPYWKIYEGVLQQQYSKTDIEKLRKLLSN